MKFEGFSTDKKFSIETITASADTLPKDILQTHMTRLATRGGHFLKDELIPVFCTALIGCPQDTDTYSNMLYTLRNDIIKSDKLLIFIDNHLPEPDANEQKAFKSINRTDINLMIPALVQSVSIENSEILTQAAANALNRILDTVKNDTPGKVYNTGTFIITWMNRILMNKMYISRKPEIPIIFFYGNINETELKFLYLMSCIGFDVAYFCPDRSVIETVNNSNIDSRMQIFDLESGSKLFPFPKKLVKAKVATVAYSAERELDKMLYGDKTFFRDFQFSDMQSMTLKTTYEEIAILWNQEIKYRSGFDIVDNRVIIPNIFAKISGVKDGDIDKYWDDVRDKITSDTIISIKAPAYKRSDMFSLNAYKPFYSGKTIFKEQLIASPLNRYSFLSDNLQNLIFNKIQEVIDSGFIKLPDTDIVSQVLYVGLNLDREILRKLQKFDFTKDTPKYIVIDNIEDTFSMIECIQLVLYNFLGFDILIYTPTGYKNIETYVSDKAFESYTMNEFVYSITIPRLKIPKETKQNSDDSVGLFSRIFKKGRR